MRLTYRLCCFLQFLLLLELMFLFLLQLDIFAVEFSQLFCDFGVSFLETLLLDLRGGSTCNSSVPFVFFFDPVVRKSNTIRSSPRIFFSFSAIATRLDFSRTTSFSASISFAPSSM